MGLRSVDIMDCGETNKLTSVETDREYEDSQEPCISRRFLMDQSTKVEETQRIC